MEEFDIELLYKYLDQYSFVNEDEVNAAVIDYFRDELEEKITWQAVLDACYFAGQYIQQKKLWFEEEY